ncbi:lipopolysaccharide core heptose(II) kinase RfaY [Fontivita pretiosa]|uniref:lipopolysaccharide core heptose(II) kinase RfaY n=1 Tax=Fontivita pretiosa TaxID=2989684 RepID=UPI003D174715
MRSNQGTTNPSCRKVFRKRLEDDCLLGGELHPSIAERLRRVRELPVTQVANLLGVERDQQGVWLVWQYVEGIDLQQLMSSELTDARMDEIAQQLRHVVTAMHAHGIVHGAIHARNVIIDSRGRVRLTHVSPYLHTDPSDDDRAVEQLLGQLAPASASVSGPDNSDADTARRLRLGGYLLALFVLGCGILIFLAILWYIRS